MNQINSSEWKRSTDISSYIVMKAKMLGKIDVNCYMQPYRTVHAGARVHLFLVADIVVKHVYIMPEVHLVPIARMALTTFWVRYICSLLEYHWSTE
jgi:hypothetical protein